MENLTINDNFSLTDKKQTVKTSYFPDTIPTHPQLKKTGQFLEDSPNKVNNYSNNKENLYWLPNHPNFKKALKDLKKSPESPLEKLNQLRHLANHNLDFTETNRLDNRLQQVLSQLEDIPVGFATLKLAILSSSTVEHLPPGIRVGALRRGLLVEIYVAPYNQYHQEILNSHSQLYQFAPDAVLMAPNYRNMAFNIPLNATVEETKAQINQVVSEWVTLWKKIIVHLNTTVIQKTLVVPPDPLFGEYDNLVPATCHNMITQINQTLREQVTIHQVLLFDVDKLAAYVGKSTWCDEALWHYAKQDISPAQTSLYGDHLARMLGAIRGLSRKCLVLDLDNTLWGGVIGDDGLSGIQLGPGNAEGEAFMAFQTYVKRLKARGVILAVCSKNEQHQALEVFEKHPNMVLRREDISIFVANWENKVSNLQKIAQELNIGLDYLVFFDDNPAERALVRQFLPMVAVPEVPKDSTDYIRCLSRAGYFESVHFSQDDASRTEQYLANAKRQQQQESAVNLKEFLRNLNMQMMVGQVDEFALPRVVQLINKTNQFNLTTHRYTEAQVKEMSTDPSYLCLYCRLKDDLGDNGLISVILAKPVTIRETATLHIDTWLVSCRVLGRQVEHESLNVLVEEAQKRGYSRLQGEYLATTNNGMVKEHYQQLGFECVSKTHLSDGRLHSIWQLDLAQFVKLDTFIHPVWV